MHKMSKPIFLEKSEYISICCLLNQPENLSMFYLLGKNFSRQHCEIFFFIFPRKKTFVISCKLSPQVKLCLECQRLFSEREKKKKIEKLSGKGLFVLRFYGPVNSMGSCRARSVYLTTSLLGRLIPLSG